MSSSLRNTTKPGLLLRKGMPGIMTSCLLDTSSFTWAASSSIPGFSCADWSERMDMSLSRGCACSDSVRSGGAEPPVQQLLVTQPVPEFAFEAADGDEVL